EMPEYQALQSCGDAIMPIAVTYTATAPSGSGSHAAMQSFWLNHPDTGVVFLLDAFNQTETESEQENLIRAIALITEEHHRLQSPSLTESMLPALDHPSPQVRVAALRVLASFADPELVAPIITAIKDEPLPPPTSSSSEPIPIHRPSIPIRQRMITSLVRSPSAAIAIPEILDLISTAPDWGVYATLIASLDWLVSEEDPQFDSTLQLLADIVLQDDREAAAFNAVLTLGSFGAAAQPTIPALVEALQTPDLYPLAQEQLPNTLIQIGTDLIATVDTLSSAEIAELLLLYKQALESVAVADLESQAEQAVFANILQVLRQAQFTD
ncbi:MAG: HEAT repeat domain-containing protein, partial [Cyanobacteria bacterium P01_E01_bin.43]